MAKITFGKQRDKSRLDLDITTSGGSQTEISADDQLDQSVRDVRIVDLPPNIDMTALASELARVLTQANKHEIVQNSISVQGLKNAQEAAAGGDWHKTKAFLQQAGKFALDIAQKIGADIATAAIKASLGL
jgi:hypothetical protein